MTQAIKKPRYRGFVTTRRPFAISLINVRQLGLPAFWLVLATLPVWAAMASRAAVSYFVRRMAKGLGFVMLTHYLYRFAVIGGDGVGGGFFIRTGLRKGTAAAQFKDPDGVNVAGLAAMCQFIGVGAYVFHFMRPLFLVLKAACLEYLPAGRGVAYKVNLAAVPGSFGGYVGATNPAEFDTVSGLHFAYSLVNCLFHLMSPFFSVFRLPLDCLGIYKGLLHFICAAYHFSVGYFGGFLVAHPACGQFGHQAFPGRPVLVFAAYFVGVLVVHLISPFRLFKYIHSIRDKYILVKRFEYQFWKLVAELIT